MSEAPEKKENSIYIGGEKYKRDRVSTITWAFMLIWAGIVFLLNNIGMLDRFLLNIPGLPASFQLLTTWQIILLGAGVILLIEVLVRLLVPDMRSNFGGPLVLAAVFIGIGLGQVFSWAITGPVILIAIGLSFLLRGFVRK